MWYDFIIKNEAIQLAVVGLVLAVIGTVQARILSSISKQRGEANLQTNIENTVKGTLNVMGGLATDQIVPLERLKDLAKNSVLSALVANPEVAKAIMDNPGLILAHITLDKDANKESVNTELLKASNEMAVKRGI